MKIQKNFAVIGNPISHSMSPGLFEGFAKKNNVDYYYSRILCCNVDQAIELIEAFDIEGINITAPFKKDILEYTDKKSEEVEILNAANTLVWKAVKSAFNTDIDGVLNSLKKYLNTDKKILVLGAGGAAKAAIYAMKKACVNNTFVANRTNDKAKILAEEFDVKFVDWADIDKFKFDIIISTIPVKFARADKIIMDKNTIVFDANYKNKPLLQIASNNESVYIDGINWLEEQGKKAYKLMTGYESDELKIEKSFFEKIKNKNKRISLIGPMASGKSRIGTELSKKLGYEFVDMDKMIEERERMSINAIFETKGESYFREIENMILKELLTKNRIVISTGGGIIKQSVNIDLLRSKSWNILLYTSPEVASERINTDKRPLLKKKNIVKTLSDIFNKRKNNYFKASDVIINRNKNGRDRNTDINKTIDLIYEDYNKTFGI